MFEIEKCKKCVHEKVCTDHCDKQGEEGCSSCMLSICNADDYDCVFYQSKSEAEPVKHGKWIDKINDKWGYSHDKCSICGWWNTRNARCYEGKSNKGHSLNYCPNCGARMDGESNE